MLSFPDLRREWLQVVTEMDNAGYLDQLYPSPCADGPTEEERTKAITEALTDRAGVPLEWHPPVLDEFGIPDELFFTYVEVIHDCVARPRQRSYHDYGDDWHCYDLSNEAGQALYRWRINEIFGRTTLDLRLAGEGEDQGYLVHFSDPSRTDLIARVQAQVTDAPQDPVARAITRFRARGATRLDKKEACRALAHELEPIRARIKQDLLSADEGMLFQIANQFAIRHNRADQHDDYADDYLDWLFWTYLATIELMRRLVSRDESADGSAS